MRESNFDERVCELKEKYVGVSDFDFETIIALEDEYSKLSETNPEHTKRRSEILRMRHELLRNLMCKPKENKEDMYIDIGRDKCIIYCNGKISYINAHNYTYNEIVGMICEVCDINKFNIYVDTLGFGMGIADELHNRNIEFKEVERALLHN